MCTIMLEYEACADAYGYATLCNGSDTTLSHHSPLRRSIYFCLDALSFLTFRYNKPKGGFQLRNTHLNFLDRRKSNQNLVLARTLARSCCHNSLMPN